MKTFVSVPWQLFWNEAILAVSVRFRNKVIFQRKNNKTRFQCNSHFVSQWERDRTRNKTFIGDIWCQINIGEAIARPMDWVYRFMTKDDHALILWLTNLQPYHIIWTWTNETNCSVVALFYPNRIHSFIIIFFSIEMWDANSRQS